MRVVLKYGGSSVATIEKIKAIAEYIVELKNTYDEIVVVTSAMGKRTNELISLAKSISEVPNKRELDTLLSIGEHQTISLVSMAINALGVDAISLTGYQANILTKGLHTKSKIQSINTEKIESYLAENKVVIIAGFQGINESGDITTLGRGGSDTSAVALAASLECECRIYTDVEGIYSVDPRVYPEAKFIEKLSYEEMMEMANLGAGVMETRAVEIGKKYGVPIFIGKTLSKTGGTYIVDRVDALEEKLITGISITKEIIITRIANIGYSSEKISKIFSIIDDAGLNINMITQNMTRDCHVDISFSCKSEEKNTLDEIVKKVKESVAEAEIDYNDNLSMLSIVGVGMINNSGIAGRFFGSLSKAGINFYQVTTSEISVSCTVDRSLIEKAVNAVAKEFSL